MRVIRSSEYRSMPWRNGGGTTTEIMVDPADADTATFEWRLSMARVEQAGPFSLFPGVERTLAILDGDGLHLEVAGREPVCLDKTMAPYPFPGDVSATAALVGGPVLDLNLMSRRSTWRHALVRTGLSSDGKITRVGEVLLALVRGGAVTLTAAGKVLMDGDTLMADAGDEPDIAVSSREPTTLYLAHLWRP